MIVILPYFVNWYPFHSFPNLDLNQNSLVHIVFLDYNYSYTAWWSAELILLYNLIIWPLLDAFFWISGLKNTEVYLNPCIVHVKMVTWPKLFICLVSLYFSLWFMMNIKNKYFNRCLHDVGMDISYTKNMI